MSERFVSVVALFLLLLVSIVRSLAPSLSPFLLTLLALVSQQYVQRSGSMKMKCGVEP
jgi:hypothetical protein